MRVPGGKWAPVVLIACVMAVYAIGIFLGYCVWGGAAKPAAVQNVETVYVRNLAPTYISDATIRNDIPAWEAAANKDFASLWHTAHVRLVFIGRAHAPRGGMTATFVDKGPVKGALAYHTVDAGAPAIVVYAGTAVYYGYSNSVSFTHELEELLADPSICATNQGYPYASVWVTHPDSTADELPQAPGTVWAQEVSDPVEAHAYSRPGANGRPVAISDFVTPDWFNDEVNGPYDFMHLVQAPFTILPGGYAQFWDGMAWNIVENFRHAGRDARGFLIAEHARGRPS